MLMNFSQNITSKSLKISHPIFLISPKKAEKSRRWTEVGTNSGTGIISMAVLE
jgi:hypothetical protein